MAGGKEGLKPFQGLLTAIKNKIHNSCSFYLQYMCLSPKAIKSEFPHQLIAFCKL